MNHYIHAQILNMQAMAKTFFQSCEMAAMKDDGHKSARTKPSSLKSSKSPRSNSARN